MKRVVVQWPRFGPYHLARLRAAHSFFGGRGVELVGLETAGSDATYAWRIESGATPFRREQVFPGRVFEDLKPAEIHTHVLNRLEELDPDAVAITSYSTPDARACLYWCRSRRRTAVLMSASKEDDAPRSVLREYLKSRLVRQFDAALVGGSPQRAYCEKLGVPPKSVFDGYDVIDNDYFAAGAEEARSCPDRYRHLPGLDHDAPFFLASGRFVARKNLDGLLRAYGYYRAQVPAPWRLVLLGDGPERQRLTEQVRTTAIEGVTFSGFRQIDEIPAYYGLADVFVHPAFMEQWGLVVNEAMAAGLPVLVSEHAGCAQDLVQDGENGFRFDPADAPTLARLMVQIASDSSLRTRMGERSRAIISDWGPERFAKGLWQAIEAGSARCQRSFNPVARTALLGLNLATRDVSAFHAIAE
ncbi:MAG TPA: glycosyltransferase family 4 protein [Rhodothermales bacterium]|nr:glycosyltransferase family 4 protein [Rhodothermales bacterium]